MDKDSATNEIYLGGQTEVSELGGTGALIVKYSEDLEQIQFMNSIGVSALQFDEINALDYDDEGKGLAFMSEKMLSIGFMDPQTGEILRHLMFSSPTNSNSITT